MQQIEQLSFDLHYTEYGCNTVILSTRLIKYNWKPLSVHA